MLHNCAAWNSPGTRDLRARGEISRQVAVVLTYYYQKKNDLTRISDSQTIWAPFGGHFSFQREHEGSLDYLCEESERERE